MVVLVASYSRATVTAVRIKGEYPLGGQTFSLRAATHPNALNVSTTWNIGISGRGIKCKYNGVTSPIPGYHSKIEVLLK